MRTKEQARKRRHDVPIIPPIVPEVVNPPNPVPPNSPPEDVIILSDSDSSEKQLSLPFYQSAEGKSVASDASSPSVVSPPSDGDYVPPSSFEYNEEVQSEYAARERRRKKGKDVASSSAPVKAKRQIDRPKPKPQVLGLVCEKAYGYVFGRGKPSLPSTEDLKNLPKNDLRDRFP